MIFWGGDAEVIGTVLDRKIIAQQHGVGEVLMNVPDYDRFCIYGRKSVLLYLDLAQVLADGMVETLRQTGMHFQFEVNGG